MIIHPSHQPEARRVFILIGVLLALMWPLSHWSGLWQSMQAEAFVIAHTMLETVSCTVALLIFGIVLSEVNDKQSDNRLCLAGCFLGVAIFDLSHTLAVPGMPWLGFAASRDQGLWFWLFARLLAAIGLLMAAWQPVQIKNKKSHFRTYVLSVLTLVAGVHIFILQRGNWLPMLTLDDGRMTALKIGLEYILTVLPLVAAFLFFRDLKEKRDYGTAAFLLAAALMAMGEAYFIPYSLGEYSYNLLGHLYKTLAYLIIFRALFIDTIQRPYDLLRRSQLRMQATLDALPDAVFVFDEEGRYLDIHSSRSQELIFSKEKMLGKTVAEVLDPESARIIYAAFSEANSQGLSQGKVIEIELGKQRMTFELYVSRMDVQFSSSFKYVLISRNITQHKQTEEARLTLSMAVSQSPISIMITDANGTIKYVNEAFTRISGYSAAEMLGKNPRILQSGKTSPAIYKTMWTQLSQGKAWQGELINKSKAGREYYESVLIYPVRDNQGRVINFLAHQEDITEKKRVAARIQQLSHYDQLTGLPNRDLLRDYFIRARAKTESLALLWIDIDRFKDVNDSLGHQNGDVLLLEISRRLRQILKPKDVLSRLSGDDFVALLPDVNQTDLVDRVQNLLSCIARPLYLGGQEISVTASIGIGLYPEDASELDALLQNAEIAMYRVKEDGRANYGFFTREMQERTTRMLALSNALKQAISNNELHLVYQPQIRLSDCKIIGAEALLRWNTSQWGAISPAEFIPIAELNKLIIPIGDWVLNTVLQQINTWNTQGLKSLKVAINLSASQFNLADLPARVKALLTESGVSASQIEFELTEAVAMKNPTVVAERIRELYDLGVQVAIDDFGIGYSSLSSLKRFKLDKIKIDQSFVQDITTDLEDQAIIAAIINMAKSLGMKTIAEGVETAEQLAFLQECGCNEIQGYYYSRPLLPHDFLAFYQSNN